MQWPVWLGEGPEHCSWVLNPSLCRVGQGWLAVERHGKTWSEGLGHLRGFGMFLSCSWLLWGHKVLSQSPWTGGLCFQRGLILLPEGIQLCCQSRGAWGLQAGHPGWGMEPVPAGRALSSVQVCVSARREHPVCTGDHTCGVSARCARVTPMSVCACAPTSRSPPLWAGMVR